MKRSADTAGTFAALVWVAVFTPVCQGAAIAYTEPPERPTSIARKLALLETLIHSPKTRQRLAASDDRQARQHYAAAVTAWQSATTAVEADDLGAAAASVRDGYRLVALALARAQDEARHKRQAVERYDALRSRIFSFSEAFQRIVYEKNDPAVHALLDQRDLSGLLSEAEAFAGAEQYDAANDLLEQAADRVERALSAARASETLLHELRFDSLEDEYAYELKRNESYEMLMGLLQRNRDVSEGAVSMLRTVLGHTASARDEAERLFEGGDVRGAIDRLERSSREASRAIQTSGLAF